MRITRRVCSVGFSAPCRAAGRSARRSAGGAPGRSAGSASSPTRGSGVVHGVRPWPHHSPRLDGDAGGFDRADHLAHAAADAGLMHHRLAACLAVGVVSVSMLIAPLTGHSRTHRSHSASGRRDARPCDGLPAVDLHVAQPALEAAPRACPLKPLPWMARQASGRVRRATPMRSFRLSVGSGSFSLALRMGLAASAAPARCWAGRRLLVHQRAGRAGQDALHRVAAEIAGLLARVDVGRADTEAVHQVGQLDGLHRAHLHALAALDAGREKVLLVQRTGRAQPLLRAYASGSQPDSAAPSTPPASNTVRSARRRSCRRERRAPCPLAPGVGRVWHRLTGPSCS
jgi:hypothetical protein